MHWTGQINESAKLELTNTGREEFGKQTTMLDFRCPA